HRSNQRLLTTLVALEDARLKAALAVLRYSQLQLAHSRLEGPWLMTVAPSAPLAAALEAGCTNELVELRLDRLLHEPLHHRPQQVLGCFGPVLSSDLWAISVREKGHRRSPGLWRAPTRCQRVLTRRSTVAFRFPRVGHRRL